MTNDRAYELGVTFGKVLKLFYALEVVARYQKEMRRRRLRQLRGMHRPGYRRVITMHRQGLVYPFPLL